MVTIMILGVMYLLLGRVLPWSLALTIALWAGRRPPTWSLTVGMVAIGIVEDIVLLQSMGIGALFFVSITCLAWLIESQYRSQWLWWWYGLGLVGELLWHVIEHRPITVIALVGQLGVLIVLHWIVAHWETNEGIYVEK